MDFTPILVTDDTDVPIKDGQLLVDVRPGVRKIMIDYTGVRQTVSNLLLPDPESDPIYAVDKPYLAWKTDIPDVSGFALQSSVALIDARVGDIEAVISPAATPDNQLADKDFVTDAITSMAADYVTPTEEGDEIFASFDALQNGPWFNKGVEYTPDKNDYALVRDDDGYTWRVMFDGAQWDVQFKINDTVLTADQILAINSGITDGLVEKLMDLPTRDEALELLNGKLGRTETAYNSGKLGGKDASYYAAAEDISSITVILGNKQNSLSANQTDVPQVLLKNARSVNGAAPGTKPLTDFAMQSDLQGFVSDADVFRILGEMPTKDELSLSTNKTDTGRTSYDGRKIYSRMWSGNISQASGGIHTLTLNIGEPIQNIVNAGGEWDTGIGGSVMSHAVAGGVVDDNTLGTPVVWSGFSRGSSSSELKFRSKSNSGRTNCFYKLWCEYTVV
jgi:hypothetical protein